MDAIFVAAISGDYELERLAFRIERKSFELQYRAPSLDIQKNRIIRTRQRRLDALLAHDRNSAPPPQNIVERTGLEGCYLFFSQDEDDM